MKTVKLFLIFQLIVFGLCSAVFAQYENEEGDKLHVSGFIDFQAWKANTDPYAILSNDFSFMLTHFNIYFLFNVNEDLSAFLEMRLFSAPSTNVTTVHNQIDTDYSDENGQSLKWNTYFIERAYLEWKKYYYAKFRAGRYITPYGIWNQDHGAPSLISIRLPMFVVPLYVKNQIPSNVTGIEMTGDVNLTNSFLINYAAYVGNDDTDQDSNFDREGEGGDKAFGGFLNLKYLKGTKFMLDIGGSGYNGYVTRVDSQPTPRSEKVYGVNQQNTFALAHIKISLSSLPFDGRFVLQAEGMKQWANVNENVEFSPPTPLDPATPEDYNNRSYYIQVEYHFYNTVAPYFRYDYYETNSEYGFRSKSLEVDTTGLNIKLYPQLIFKAELGRMRHDVFPGETAKRYDSDIYRASLTLVF